MKKLLKVVVAALAAVVLVAVGFFTWAHASTNKTLSRTFEAHVVDFPVPYPLSEEEREGLTPEEAEALALERALERGRHLLAARYACGECHGSDFGGGVMVDAFPIGSLLGPNLTTGQGGITANYTIADWDRIVRHGIRPDGGPAVMPSEDFLRMSDQELSDIIAYIRSLPPVDNEVPPVRLGPLGKVLVATGQIHLSADLIPEHTAPHLDVPPSSAVTVEFGEHLAAVCTGCHGMEFTGGPIAGGDPAWVPAADITARGLRGWSYADFRTAMLEARRPDGTEIRLPMSMIIPFAQQMTDVEMEALWIYLNTLNPQP